MHLNSPLKNRPRGEHGSFAPALRYRILDKLAGLPPVRRLERGRNLSLEAPLRFASLTRLFFNELLDVEDNPRLPAAPAAADRKFVIRNRFDLTIELVSSRIKFFSTDRAVHRRWPDGIHDHFSPNKLIDGKDPQQLREPVV